MKLSLPDRFGNYWLARDHKDGPAIFTSKRIVKETVEFTGWFYLFLGPRQGFVWSGGKLRPFSHAEDALSWLEKNQ